VANENVVFNGDAFADEGMARDLTIVPYGGVLLDFDEGADFDVVADGATVEVDELGKFDVLAKLDVV
jgi:hypothetical protein